MRALRVCALLALFAACLFPQQEQPQPQQPGPGGPPGGGNPPGGNIPNTGTPGQPGGGRPQNPFPDTTQQQQQRFPEMQRPIFLSGKVVTEEGVPPPEPVTIERVCADGRARPEGYTDSKGRFSFELGRNFGVMQDASVSTADVAGPGGRGSDPFGNRGGGSMGPGGMGGFNERDLMGCEIRASLPGYTSSVVNLSGRRLMDNPDVGTIVLKRIAGVEGMTFSMTTAMAPKDARKAFDKAREQMKKKKTAEARKELEKAVGIYPKYAAAWFELGVMQQQAGEKAEARKSYEEALKADAKYISPYLQLAILSAGEGDWQAVDGATDRVIQLNPVNFPQAYYINSVANMNLQNYEAAEKSALEAVRLDEQHRWPKALHILAVLQANKGQHQQALDNLRGYLKFNPGGNDKPAVEKDIARLEEMLKGGTTQAQPNND